MMRTCAKSTVCYFVIKPSKENGRVKFANSILPGIGALKIRLHRALDWDNAKTVTGIGRLVHGGIG